MIQPELKPLLRAPITGAALHELEPWLLADDDGGHYPVLCGTPALLPQAPCVLTAQCQGLARAFAELGVEEGPRKWALAKVWDFNPADPPPQDTEIRGEGYPGFWRLIEPAAFVAEMTRIPPEARLLQELGDRRFRFGLDLGAGQGGMTQRMAERCGGVIGLETNFYLAALANRLLASNEIPVRLFDPLSGPIDRVLAKKSAANALALCADALSPPLREGAFDWVHIGHLLDLVDEPADLLTVAADLLSPGGLLTLCTPWDIEDESLVAAAMACLEAQFAQCWRLDSWPWLRCSHRRRFILHQDWLWMGVKR